MPGSAGLPSDWFLKGSHDLITARLAVNEGGLEGTASVLMQQAAEKYLKGYLISKGWYLKKTHDLRDLLRSAIEYDNRFLEFSDLARVLTALYIDDRYPSDLGSGYTKTETESLLKQTEKLIDFVLKLT